MEQDARAKASEAIDRRARQRQAAAAALLELTPEAIAAEEERQMKFGADGDIVSQDEMLQMLRDDKHKESPADQEAMRESTEYLAGETLSSRLADAVQPIIAGSEEIPHEIVDRGTATIQWALMTGEESAYELALQVQVDEQPPAGVVLEITDEMLDIWRKGEGLQKNRVQHKKFAAGIIEKAVELAAEETGNHLIFALETLLREPTRAAVGDDEA